MSYTKKKKKDEYIDDSSNSSFTHDQFVELYNSGQIESEEAGLLDGDDFTHDKFIELYKNGQVAYNTDPVENYFSQAKILFDELPKDDSTPTYEWASKSYNYINRIDDISREEQYIESYLETLKGTDDYEAASKQFNDYRNALAQQKNYLNELNKFASQYDNEEDYNKAVTDINRRQKYQDKSYDELIDASKNAEDEDEAEWLRGYANETISYDEAKAKQDELNNRLAEINAEIEKRKNRPLPFESNPTDDSGRNPADPTGGLVNDPLIKLQQEADAIKKRLNDEINPLVETKKTQKNNAEYTEKYKGLNYTELKSKIGDANSEEENKWLEDKAAETSTSADYEKEIAGLEAENAEIKKRLDNLDFADEEESAELQDKMRKNAVELSNLQALLKSKEREEKVGEYEKSVRENEDFEENSKFAGEKEPDRFLRVFSEGNADDVYDAINNRSVNWAPSDAWTDDQGVIDRLSHMTDDEKATFNYLYNTGKKDEALEYKNSLERKLNARYTEAKNAEEGEYAKEHPVLGSLKSVGTNLLSGGGVFEDIGNRLINEPIDINSPAHDMANQTRAIRQSVGDSIDNEAGKFAYDTVMSAVDNAVVLALATATGGAAGAAFGGSEAAAASIAKGVTSTTSSLIMGSQVATNTVIDAKERGLTDDQAVTLGILYGAAETIGEKVSIGAWMKEPASVLSSLKKSFIAEGSEEVVTNWLDRAADVLVTGDKNQVNQMYKNYLDQGYSDKEAFTLTAYNLIGEDTKSFIAGGVSGAAMGGAHMAVSGVSNKIGEIRTKNAVANLTASELTKSENKETLNSTIDFVKNNAESGSKEFKLSEKLGQAVENGETISVKDAKKLLKYSDNLDQKKYNTATKGFTDEEKAIVNNAVHKLTHRQSLSEQEYAQIKDNDKIIKAVSDYSGIEQDEVVELLDSSKFKDNLKYYKSNGNGLLEIDGKEFRGTVEIENTDPATGKATLKLTSPDGKDVRLISSDNANFKNDTEARLYATAANFKNPNEANAFVENYNGGDVKEYLNEWNLYSNYGSLGFNAKQIYQRINQNVDTPSRKAAYYSGMENFKAFAQIQNINKRAYEAAAQSFKGYQRGTFVSNVSSERLNKMSRAQRNSIRELKMFTFAGLNVELFESKADKHGNYQGENGSFNAKTKTLRVDINAGFANNEQAIKEAAKSYIRLTVGHELTHAAEQGGGYMKLRAEIIRTLEAAGFDYKGLVDKKLNELKSQDKYKDLGQDELYRLADSEVIADCCETLLNDSKVFEKLFNADKTLAEKFINAVKRAIEKLRQFFKENPTYARTEYGKALQEAMSKVENRVQELWDEAVAQGIRAENKESGKVSFNERGNINSNDIIILRSIGRKSVFNFTSEDINKSEKWARKFYKELGEKSPFFRAWFGDWRISDKTRVQVVDIEKGKGYSSSTISIDDLGGEWSVRTSTLGARNTKSHAGIAQKSVYGLKNIAELIKNSIYLDCEVHEHHLNNKPNDNIAFDHKFYALGRDNENNIGLYKITIDDIFQSKSQPNDLRFHNLRHIVNIEKVADNINDSSSQNKSNEPYTANVDVSTTNYTVADLYAFVKQYDKEFKPTESSKVVDKDGKPLVVYHGTSRGGFTTFDTYGSNFGLFGYGSYFTDDRSVAESYTNKGKGDNKQVYDVYLDIKNPIDMDMKADISAWEKTALEGDEYFDESYFKDCKTNEDCFRALKEYCADEGLVRYEAEEYITSVIEGMGYDGITHIGGGRYNKKDNNRHRVWIVFDPEQVKSATDNIGTYDGNNSDINYSDRFDTDYLSAVERGDMKTAQQMVDEAAKAAGYDMHLYHGAKSGGGFTVFKDWQYFTADKKYAEKYTQRNTESNSLYEVFVKSNRMFDTRNADDQAVFVQYRSEYGMSELQESGLPDWTDGYDLSEIIEENNLDYDGIILDEGVQYYPNAKEYDDRYRRVLSYVIRKSNQIKSADPVTYDDDGNVIPLSERFNEAKEDMRYSDRYTNDDIRNSVQNHFGHTYSWNETGYITTDGQRLDFSGRHEGAPGGHRYVDHRDVWDGYPEELQDELDGSEAMYDFISRGNIRVYPETGGIHLAVEPTPEQKSRLRDYISRERGEVTLDITDKDGNNLLSTEYPKGTSSSKIFNDISEFFANGTKPTVSDLGQFRYQDRYNEFDDLFDMGEDLFEGDSKREIFDEMIEKYPYEALYIIQNAAEQTVENILTKTKSVKLDDSTYLYVARKFMQAYNISRAANPEEDNYLAAKIKNIVARIEAGELAQSEIMNEFINTASDALVLSGTLDDTMKNEREFVISLIKGKKLLVTDQQEDHIRENYGDLRRYRTTLGHGYVALEKNAKKKSITGAQGVYIEDIIEEVQEAYPQLIDEDANQITGFGWLEKLLNERLEPTFKSDSYSTPEIDAVNGGYEIMTNLVDQKARQIVRDNKNGQKYAQLGNTARELAQEQRKAVKEAVSKVKEKERQKAKKDIKEAREKAEARYKAKLEKKEQQFKEKLDEQREKTRELRREKNDIIIAEKQKRVNDLRRLRDNRERRDVIEKINKTAAKMRQMILRPTDTAYVPDEFKNGFIEVTDGITQALKLSDDTKIGQHLNKLSDLLRKLATDDRTESVFGYEFDENFRDRVQEFAAVINGKKIDKSLTLREANDIHNLLKSVVTIVRNANKLINSQERRSISEAGIQIMLEQENLDSKWLNKQLKTIKKYFMTPLRMSEIINAYNDKAVLTKLVNELNRGVRKKNMFYMVANKMFDDYREENVKELDHSSKDVREIRWTDNAGNSRVTRMTGMQAMQICMTWNREIADDNLVHISEGGLTIFDPKQLAKGNNKKALEKATKIHGVNNSFITSVASSLTRFEKGYIDIAEQYFNEYSKDAINETSLALKHYKIANSKYYIPIKVDQNSIAKEIEGIKFDSSVENQGMFNSVVPKSRKSIYIQGLDSLINNHIQGVSNYYGLAIPIRNLNKTLNVRNVEYDADGVVVNENTVKDALNKNWGEMAINNYEQMLTDLQNSRASKGEQNSKGINKFIRGFRSNFVTSVLNFNPSVTLKQAASYFTAGAYIDGTILGKGFAHFWAKYGRRGRYKALLDEIDSHTAQHYIRRQGLSSNEIADINDNWLSKAAQNTKIGRKITTSKIAQGIPSGFNPNKWIQNMDCLTTAMLWVATKDQVNRDFNKAKKEIGTDEYWQAVTDLYDKVIEDTQPMYDPLHRPEVLKSSNELVKSIFMFKTQPLQNAGIIYDALGRAVQGNKGAIRKLGKAVLSQGTSLVVFALMTFVVSLARHNIKRYRDENDEWTVGSTLHQIFEDILANGAGILFPFGGTEIVTFLTQDGDAVQDNVAVQLNKFGSAFTDFWEVIDNYNDAMSMGLDTDPQDILSAFKSFAVIVSQDITGLPVNNAIKNFEGVAGWINDKFFDDDNQILAPTSEPKNNQVAGRYARQIENGNTAEAEKILNEYYQKELEKAKANKDIKNPKSRASQKTRDMLANDAIKAEYQEAFLKNDEKTMQKIVKILYSANKYMKWGKGKNQTPLDEKLKEWRKSAKEDMQDKYDKKYKK